MKLLLYRKISFTLLIFAGIGLHPNCRSTLKPICPEVFEETEEEIRTTLLDEIGDGPLKDLISEKIDSGKVSDYIEAVEIVEECRDKALSLFYNVTKNELEKEKEGERTRIYGYGFRCRQN